MSKLIEVRLEGTPEELARELGERLLLPMYDEARRTMPAGARHEFVESLITFAVAMMAADLGNATARASLARMVERFDDDDAPGAANDAKG